MACQAGGYESGSCKKAPFVNGSDGSVVFDKDTTLDSNKNYENMTVNPGVTVTLKSGIEIRVRDTLIVKGTISADGQGGLESSNGPGIVDKGGKGGKGGNGVAAGGNGGNYGGGGGGGGGDYSVCSGRNGGSYSGGGGIDR